MKTFSSIIICILSLFVGLAITLQINESSNSDVSGLISINKAKIYEEELQKVRTDKKASLRKLAENENKLEEFEQKKSEEDASLRSITAQIEKYKMSAGVYDVKGPGLIITIEDPEITIFGESGAEDTSIIMSNYELLIGLVNDLKKSGAEAVCVNGQRIIATTEFNYIGNAVYINTVPTAPPYIVKAIGDPKGMESFIGIHYGVIDTMRNQYNLLVNVKEKKELQVPRYHSHIKYKYAKPIEEI